jgi:poly-gamma-glutamate synthesis protein (capsule biosynthesis protein)
MRGATRLLRTVTLAASLAMAATLAVRGQAPRTPVERPDFTMALAGDSIITRRLSIHQEPEFLKLVEIVRGADAAFTNLEMLFHDYESYPMHESGGTWMRADPALLKDLVWAGFDLVSRANNHAGDYGVAGMRLTTKYVREAGLVQAGVGDSLAEAREAKFLETPKRRIALVSTASTFPDHSRASATRGDVPARPGLNPLRFTTTTIVSRERLDALRGVARDVGMRVRAEGDTLDLWGVHFAVGEKPGIRTEPNKADLEGMARVVRSASRMADYTVVSIHSHEGGADRTQPADFLVAFAHAMVDAGADVVVGHGPHVVRGIEMYKGKAILYSVGDFIFENETLLRFPHEAYEAIGLGRDSEIGDFNDARSDHDRKGFNADREVWESFVATVQWSGKQISGLQLYPITLGFGQSMTERGRPRLANPELAKHILENVSARSRPFGTRVVDENGIGRIVITPSISSSGR